MEFANVFKEFHVKLQKYKISAISSHFFILQQFHDFFHDEFKLFESAYSGNGNIVQKANVSWYLKSIKN